MKKLLTIGFAVVALALVGCSTTDKPVANTAQSTISNANASVDVSKHHKQKCKKCHKHHHCGKLGVEKTTKDVAK